MRALRQQQLVVVVRWSRLMNSRALLSTDTTAETREAAVEYRADEYTSPADSRHKYSDYQYVILSAWTQQTQLADEWLAWKLSLDLGKQRGSVCDDRTGTKTHHLALQDNL